MDKGKQLIISPDPSEMDYGPWMLVSQWRYRCRGHKAPEARPHMMSLLIHVMMLAMVPKCGVLEVVLFFIYMVA